MTMDVTITIHRAIERQAAAGPDVTAFRQGSRALTYRELNGRANTVARRLINSGFTRGSVAAVREERSPELAITLLAVLKAGGAYMWLDPSLPHDYPRGFSILERGDGREQRCRLIDLSGALAESERRLSPNLPILTRSTDVACVLPAENGPGVLVPHATIAELGAGGNTPGPAAWSDAGAFDLWVCLMSGSTLVLDEQPIQTVAA